MTRKFNDFYNADLDTYDIDAFAASVGLTQPGTHTPEYELRMRAAIEYMDGYNRASTGEDDGTARGWLATLTGMLLNLVIDLALIAPIVWALVL